MNKQLIRKYNIPGPRYTSYPTVPYWDKIPPNQDTWENAVKDVFKATNQKEGISLYIHLPFCERLCTYCGCNTRITVNHQVEMPYIETLLKEWQLYLDLFEEKPITKEIHLGGGTPTFFSPKHLEKLIKGILEKTELTKYIAFGFEAHPKNTSKEHLEVLYDLGFRRLSLGIQDFDPKVQKVINRQQSFEQVEEVTKQAREIGYTSINYDLIFGLPFQQLSSVQDTIKKVNLLRPERIAFYSYAHVPWIKPSQRSFTEADLPTHEEKRALYELGKQMFEDLGYLEIGMDHFALPKDSLSVAFKNKRLHRNFMGYTDEQTHLLIGLGASSISDTWTAFAQNIKKVEDYTKAVNQGDFPFFRGHMLTKEDLILRQHILNIMCHFETSWQDENLQTAQIYDAINKLEALEKDGLLELHPYQLVVTEKGKPFVRNICMALDAKLMSEKPKTQIFSQTV